MDCRFVQSAKHQLMDGNINLSKYNIIDLILGEQKKTPMPKYQDQTEFEAFPVELQNRLRDYLNSGGNLFLSGAYIASDLYDAEDDSSSIKFANEVLKYNLRTGHAVKTGKLFSINENFISKDLSLEFNTSFNDSIYKVEAPDAIAGINGGEILLRYSENNFSAAVGYKGDYGVVALGFPYETILGEKQRY